MNEYYTSTIWIIVLIFSYFLGTGGLLNVGILLSMTSPMVPVELWSSLILAGSSGIFVGGRTLIRLRTQ